MLYYSCNYGTQCYIIGLRAGPGEARILRVFKNKWFLRFARQQGIEDEALCEAVARAEKRLIDADLGGGVIKQRIARLSEGKSGGFRSIVLFRSSAKAFFSVRLSKERAWQHSGGRTERL